MFKFKLVLKPHPSDTDPPIEQHKIVIQLIGGALCFWVVLAERTCIYFGFFMCIS